MSERAISKTVYVAAKEIRVPEMGEFALWGFIVGGLIFGTFPFLLHWRNSLALIVSMIVGSLLGFIFSGMLYDSYFDENHRPLTARRILLLRVLKAACFAAFSLFFIIVGNL